MEVLNTFAMSAILVVLLGLSGFFSAAETAFTGFSEIKMKRLAVTEKRARLVLELNRNYGDVLTTLLIGNNIVNILATSLATVIFVAEFGDVGVTVSTVAMTVAVLVFGEVSPKTIAKERPEKFAMFSAPAIKVFSVLFRPLCKLFGIWKKFLARIFRFGKRPSPMTEEEFGIIVSDIADEGVIRRGEERLIKNAIRFETTAVASIMVPAEKMTCVKEEWNAEEIREVFEEYNYSRVPVIRGSVSEISGILYRTDFYRMRLCGKEDIKPLLKPVFYCKAADRLPDLLKVMQGSRRHLAVVADGSRVLGLVTVEDIIEQLVGEIEDRYDSVPEKTVNFREAEE